MKTIVHVVGARPNYMKIAPVMEALRPVAGIRQMLVNTGQHYDESMAGSLLQGARPAAPDRDLGVGSGTHAVQTAKVMIGVRGGLPRRAARSRVVVGDVNSTMAASLVAAKLRDPGRARRGRPAQLRPHHAGGDQPHRHRSARGSAADAVARRRRQPAREGMPAGEIHLVGNVMIDTLCGICRAAERSIACATACGRRRAVRRPDAASAVERRRRRHALRHPARGRARSRASMPVVFPVHPRTRSASAGSASSRPDGYPHRAARLHRLPEPDVARGVVLTDSGGLQEESTALGIPCLTLRENTERPVTVTHGTNRVVGTTRRRSLPASSAR